MSREEFFFSLLKAWHTIKYFVLHGQARPTTVTAVWKPVCAAEGHIPSLAFLNTTKNVVNESLLLSASVFRHTAEFNLPPLSLTTSVFQVFKRFSSSENGPC